MVGVVAVGGIWRMAFACPEVVFSHRRPQLANARLVHWLTIRAIRQQGMNA